MHFSSPSQISTFLVDNGSLQPASTLQLREMAIQLSRRTGVAVEPVSLLHSSAIPREELQGTKAEILEPAIRRRSEKGAALVRLVPLFFGPSGALTEYVPQRVEKLRRDFPRLRVDIARPVVDVREADDRIARVLAERVQATLARSKARRPAVILVDHGSPRPQVTEVRNHVARQLQRILGETVAEVRAASMERREGAGYAFNEPLLERALAAVVAGRPDADIVVSLLFFSPGRHAGPGGDIDRICRSVVAPGGHGRVWITDTLGMHPLLLDVLADRIGEFGASDAKEGAADQTSG